MAYKIYTQERVSGVDLMKALLKFRRYIERQSAEQVRSLGRIHRQIVVAAEQALHRIINNDRLRIPVPARVVNRRRFDRSRSRD
jgi:hypothetical protein